MSNTVATWAGNRTCQPAAVLRPNSEDEVADILARATAKGRRVKPIGASHSWSGAQLTDGSLLRLDRMDRVLAVDSTAGTVRVQAGIRLQELMGVLAGLRLSLPVRGSIAEQSVAGATATGTHGSAPDQGCLSTLITALRLVAPDGTVHDLSQDDPGAGDLFNAARVGLGALGVVTEVTLRVVPDFVLREEAEAIPAADAVRDFDAIAASAPFVKLWLVPHTGKAVVFRYWPTEEEPNLSAVADWIDDRLVNRGLLRGLMSSLRRSDRLAPAVMQLVGATYLSSRTRVGSAREILGLNVPPVHGEIEYALPRSDGREAFGRLEEMIRVQDFRVGFVQEIRFAAGDDIWLSPGYARDTCWLNAMVPVVDSGHPYSRAAEAMLQEYGGRPHWGKTFTADRDYLATVYPRLADFAALRHRLDPAGVLRNAFVDRVFGDGG